MTPDEARAVVRLWAKRQWERQACPTVADVAEALEIPAEEASALLSEVRAGAVPSGGQTRQGLFTEGEGVGSSRTPAEAGRIHASRLVLAAFGLTGFFSLALERLLA